MYRYSSAVLAALVGKRLPRGLLGPVVCAGAAVLLIFGTAAPALADDPPAGPRAVPQPRAGRAAPSGSSYDEIVNYANDSARDLSALQQQARDVTIERVAVSAEIKRLARLTDRPQLVRDRLERQALRLSVSDAVDPTVSPAAREAAAEMRALRTELSERSAALEAESAALAPYLTVVPSTGGWWRAPVKGELTQEFGPTHFSFEPARTYRGVYYPRFHEGVDIAAAMYSPVVAAAPGRVVWVGKLPDGAMVLLIAHAGGLVSLYAHLDDSASPPRVSAGDQVQGGQIIGAIGMTGMTTGPHTHFVVWRDGELIDPLSLVAD